MKTAEEILIKAYLEYNSHVQPEQLLPLHYPFYIIEAMKTYALAAIEEQLKVTNEEVVNEDHLNGRYFNEDLIANSTRIDLK